MSNFVINRNGLDQVTLEFTTSGRSEGSINLRYALLDENKDYVFCVDHLNAPLDSVPINTSVGKELFRIIRRNVGRTLDDPIQTTVNANVPGVYTLSQNYFDVSSFVRSLNNWARGVELAITKNGLTDFRTFGGLHDAASAAASEVAPLRILAARNDAQIYGAAAYTDDDGNDIPQVVSLGTYDMIRFRLTVDGTMSIEMSHDFVNNFVLQFTRYGAEILALVDKLSAVTHHMISYNDDGDPQIAAVAQTDYYLAVTDRTKFKKADWLENPEVGDPNIIKLGNNNREVVVHSEHSLYMTFDQRVKISISSHLPMLNNVHVREGKESVDRNIVDVFFDQKVVSSVTFDEDGLFVQSTTSNTMYAGQYPFIKKTDRGKQWHKLLTSFNLRYFRFSIYVTYRTYNALKDEWVFDTQLLPMDQSQFWDFSLRFLSLI